MYAMINSRVIMQGYVNRGRLPVTNRVCQAEPATLGAHSQCPESAVQ